MASVLPEEAMAAAKASRESLTLPSASLDLVRAGGVDVGASVLGVVMGEMPSAVALLAPVARTGVEFLSGSGMALVGVLTTGLPGSSDKMVL